MQRVDCESGVIVVEDQEYTNPFVDVHRKAKAAKDRARETNKNDAELRESRSVRESEEMLAPRKQIGTGSQGNPRRSA
jgi:hypothetical protein